MRQGGPASTAGDWSSPGPDHTTLPTVSVRPGPIPPGPAPACDGLPLARRPPRRRDVLGQVEVRLAPSFHWTRRSRDVGSRVTLLVSHPSRGPLCTLFISLCPPSQSRAALYFLFPPESSALKCRPPWGMASRLRWSKVPQIQQPLALPPFPHQPAWTRPFSSPQHDSFPAQWAGCALDDFGYF